MGQFKALITKNWILYKRHKLGAFFEIAIPVISALFIILSRQLITIETYEEGQFLQKNQSYSYKFFGKVAISQANSIIKLKDCADNETVGLAPKDDKMVESLKIILENIYNFNVTLYNDNQEINQIVRDKDYGKQQNKKKFCFAVAFHDTTNSYNYSLRYEMRQNTAEIPWTNRPLTFDEAADLGIYLRSFRSGSMGLPTIINNLILDKQSEEMSNTFQNTIAPIYQEEYTDDPVFTYLGQSFDFILLLPLLTLYTRQTGAMLEEKEKRIRQNMSIMGMKTKIYYFTWFLRYFLTYLVVHLIVSGIIVSQFPFIPFYIPLIILLMFDILLIIQSFFVQVFVTNAKIGIIFSLLFFIIQYSISFIVSNNENPSLEINRSVSVVGHVASTLAVKTMLYAQSVKKTLNFTDIFNYYQITIAIVSLAGNIVFWGILTWYLEQVFPNQYGAKKHPFFCCVSKRRQKSKKQDSQTSSKKSMQSLKAESQKNLKEEPHQPEIESVQGKFHEMEDNQTIKIMNVNKQFDNFLAVKDLSLTIYTGQIFVLLGHNGAGKTTTISMLTGMLDPTSGIIEICGKTQVDEVRKILGVCPQHDTLYDLLTVEQHITLIGTFKGLSGQVLKDQVQSLIHHVNLQEKRHEYAKNLSGGQRRRLSVALAFAGDSKVIILDQPTSGMDASARRHIWQMLKNYKNDRIILMTTHFMDEADYLGDRIAIMSKGSLMTLGSNIYLKNKFGIGYNITFVKESLQFESKKILDLIYKHVPGCTVLSDVSAELGVQLPMHQIEHFPALFQQIEQEKQELGIESYGISITTLQQVFLKIGQSSIEQQHRGEGTNMLEQDKKSSKLSQGEDKKTKQEKQMVEQIENIQNIDREDGACQRFLSHLKATILKRIRVIKRDLKSFLFQLILPMAVVALALYLMSITFIEDFPSQQLSFRTYLDENKGDPVYLPISASDQTRLSNLAKRIEEIYGNDIETDTHLKSSNQQFDEQILFEKKQKLSTLKGGIYFGVNSFQSADNRIFRFTSIVNTKSPTSILTVQTLAAETLINQIADKNISISINNYPLPRTYEQLEFNKTISGYLGALVFSLALGFKFASIAAFIVKERVNNCKHQQIVSGMNIGSYWFGNYIYDYILYAVVAGFSVGMCVAFDIAELIEEEAIGAMNMLFFFFGLANIPFTYVVSNLFQKYSNAQGSVYFFNFAAGGLLPIIILTLRWIDSDDSAVIAEGIAWVLRLMPPFAFGEGMINLSSLTILNFTRTEQEELKVFDMSIATAPIIFLVATAILYTGVVFLIELLGSKEGFMRFFSSENKYTETQQITQTDVLNEQEIALNSNPAHYFILTQHLRKVYKLHNQRKYKIAVDNLSFAVPKGQVFGLLGVNGAGKTTTFKMLAGEIISTSGDSYFCGMRINQHLGEIRKNLGYCPQFDALVDNLTVREQLELYYDLKCLPSKYKQKAIQIKIKEMNLQEYRDKLSGKLSGGNKRKLSVAMAMIGNPSVIFLDQPSTGMDPQARRFMWKIISRVSTQKKYSTIILTTHSMQQAQALSTRIGIMVKGNFRCIGTPQHIKSKYGKGYQLEIKVTNVKKEQIGAIKSNLEIAQQRFQRGNLKVLLNKLEVSQAIKEEISVSGEGAYIWQELQKKGNSSVDALIEFCEIRKKIDKLKNHLRERIGQIVTLENFQTFIRFKTIDQVTVGRLFQVLETGKKTANIVQYSIKQASVEQIFNKFADQVGTNE